MSGIPAMRSPQGTHLAIIASNMHRAISSIGLERVSATKRFVSVLGWLAGKGPYSRSIG